MGTTLTGQQIDLTYDGLIKTQNNDPIDGTLRALTDGLGNDLPVEVSTTGVNFTGTVTGIPAMADTTYTLGVDESVPDGIITLTDSNAAVQQVVFQANGNIVFDTTVSGDTLDVTVAPYDISSQQAGIDVDIQLNSTFGSSDITLEAGTNITLTNTGNNILIDAASGGGGGTFESPLSPARQYKTTTNSKWNFAMPQDGNNYDGGGFQPFVDANPGRRFFTQIYSDTVTDFAVLVGDGFTGNLIAELFDVWPNTGMPRNVIATTGNFAAQSQGTGLTWHKGSFATTQTLNYEEYYIAVQTTTDKGPALIYSALGAGGYINRLVEFNINQHPNNTSEAVDYIGGGMNDTSSGNYLENYDFSFRIDMFNTILFKQ